LTPVLARSLSIYKTLHQTMEYFSNNISLILLI
jgi:hypothetical protein